MYRHFDHIIYYLLTKGSVKSDKLEFSDNGLFLPFEVKPNIHIDRNGLLCSFELMFNVQFNSYGYVETMPPFYGTLTHRTPSSYSIY